MVPRASRFQAALAITAAAVLACTACAKSTPRAVDPSATTDDGKVTVACGATEQWCDAMTKAFSKSTGLQANFVRLSSGETVARIEAGKANPEFDVWHGGPADGYAAAASKGLLDSYVSPNASAVAAKYKDAAGWWTGVYVGALGFCSNQKILAEKHVPVPTSWQDLLNPALSKNVAVAHPSTSGTAYTALWTQVARNGNNIEAAKDYMRRLHPNVLQYPKTGLAPGQMAARGEIAVGVVFAHDCVALQEEGFKDLTVTFPSEGTGFEVGGVALLKGAQSPVSAKKYIDWALTAAAQEIGPTVKAYQLPTCPTAKVDSRVPDLGKITLVDYDFTAAGKAKADLTKWFNDTIVPAPK